MVTWRELIDSGGMRRVTLLIRRTRSCVVAALCSAPPRVGERSRISCVNEVFCSWKSEAWKFSCWKTFSSLSYSKASMSMSCSIWEALLPGMMMHWVSSARLQSASPFGIKWENWCAEQFKSVNLIAPTASSHHFPELRPFCN